MSRLRTFTASLRFLAGEGFVTSFPAVVTLGWALTPLEDVGTG
jgi:hypothetical protein